MAAIEAQGEKRGLWWWLTAILAPIGIISGPIAIAEMFKGFIDWHGPIQYVVHWWGEHISLPFHGIFEWLAGLIDIDLPDWSAWVTDYLALGILLAFGFFRASALTNRLREEDLFLASYLVEKRGYHAGGHLALARCCAPSGTVHSFRKSNQ